MKERALTKLSPAFSSRLRRASPRNSIDAILLIETAVPLAKTRSARISATSKEAAEALPSIDAILEGYGGKRLSPAPDAFGSVRIQGSAKAIRELAKLASVRAILENQDIHILR